MISLAVHWFIMSVGANYFLRHGLSPWEHQLLLSQGVHIVKGTVSSRIPRSFDARLAWLHCADIIGNIRDQASCGSCWAVSVAGAISDRICIQSGGTVKVNVSAIQITTCTQSLYPAFASGCAGGFDGIAWVYAAKEGVVSERCQPYPFASCIHHHRHPANQSLKECSRLDKETPNCMSSCVNKEIDYKKNRYFIENVRAFVQESDAMIQTEIMHFGPVVSSFLLHEDFFKHRNGVYIRRKENNPFVYAHSVRIVGWGEEKGLPYWLIANSYNQHWGENGYGRLWRHRKDVQFGDTVVFAEYKSNQIAPMSLIKPHL